MTLFAGRRGDQCIIFRDQGSTDLPWGDLINESSLGEQHISRERSTSWLSGRVLISRSRGFRFESHWRHCVESLSKTHHSLLSGATQEDQSQHN